MSASSLLLFFIVLVAIVLAWRSSVFNAEQLTVCRMTRDGPNGDNRSMVITDFATEAAPKRSTGRRVNFASKKDVATYSKETGEIRSVRSYVV